MEVTAKQMEAMARRWETERARPGKRPSAAERRMDAVYECWKRESAAGCLPCLLEELE